jgi:hypothetical protein
VVQDCQRAVSESAKKLTTAWEKWKAADEDSRSSRMLLQHIRAEQQLQRAVDVAMDQLQVCFVLLLLCDGCRSLQSISDNFLQTWGPFLGTCAMYHL